MITTYFHDQFRGVWHGHGVVSVHGHDGGIKGKVTRVRGKRNVHDSFAPNLLR